MSWPSDGLPRFKVTRVRGEGGVSYYVLDRAYAHREVARFAFQDDRDAAGRYHDSPARRRSDAHALAAELEAKYGAA